MFQLSSIVLASALGLLSLSTAQQFPLPVTYDTVLKSPINSDITISYKQPDHGTCNTTLSTQKQYSGYVNIPPSTLAPYQQDYPINTFFWFFEARTNPDTAPLTVWLNGGPGSSSMIGLFQELGPCEVVQLPNGTFGTQPRLWGWDRASNLLFIDQPTQTGFSYDSLVNASVDMRYQYPFTLENRMTPQPIPADSPPWRFLNGTFASGHDTSTESTALIAANACWHILQSFFSVFPQYNPGATPGRDTVEPAGINLFTESYGGIYGPTFADFFEDQNDRREKGLIPRSALDIKLNSLGIVNGVVDSLAQTIAALNYTHSNNYGVQELDDKDFEDAIYSITAPGGCQDLLIQCRAKAHRTDPEGTGRDDETNILCSRAHAACLEIEYEIYRDLEESVYDIRVKAESGPGAAYQEYLNYPKVLQSIGAPLNYTQSSSAVYEAFNSTGDAVLGTQMEALADLLARGIRVAFVYGDADIICNWYGGQNVSLELAQLVPAYETAFPAAGYADIFVNRTYIGGQVRQFGNLSFSRIYDAGHLVPLYQPETAFTVFTRIIQGDDIGMGRDIDSTIFGTLGSIESAHINKKSGKEHNSSCWLRDPDTCTSDQRRQIKNDEGIVTNGVWSQKATEDRKTGPSGQGRIAIPSVPSPSHFTGVYAATATAMPKSNSAASSRLHARQLYPKIDGGEVSRAHSLLVVLVAGIAICGGLSLIMLCGCALCVFLRRRRRRNEKYMAEPSITGSETGQKPGLVERIRRATTSTVSPRADIERPQSLSKSTIVPEPEKKPSIVERIRRVTTRKESVPVLLPSETTPTTRANSNAVAPDTVSEQSGSKSSTRRNSDAVIPEAVDERPDSVPSTRNNSNAVAPDEIIEQPETVPSTRRNSEIVPATRMTSAAGISTRANSDAAVPEPAIESETMPSARQSSIVSRQNSEQPEATPEPEKKPSIVERIRCVTTRKGSVPVIPPTVDESPESATPPKLPSRANTTRAASLASEPVPALPSRSSVASAKNEDTGEKPPTPPPRVATLPPPSRASTAGAPLQQATQPLPKSVVRKDDAAS